MGQDQSSTQLNVAQEQHQQREKVEGIVVVSKAVEKPEEFDEDLLQLKSLKLSKPILKNSLGEVDYVNIPRIYSGPISEMILRYQFHLTECAEAVAFDQNVISKRIKDVDAMASNVYKNICERQRFIDSVILQVTKVSEVQSLIPKIEENLKNIRRQFDNLNEMLPEHQRIHDVDIL